MTSPSEWSASDRSSLLRSLRRADRVVVKIGSAVLTDDHGRLDPKILKHLATQIAPLANALQWPTVVSSGAIAVGIGVLRLDQRPRTMAGLQAAAAVGQSKLMETWSQAFGRYQLPVAQMLLTHADLAHRQRFLNARRALGELERQKSISIINENDSVSFEEIAFGDNDELAAQVTNLIDAPLLIMLSSAPGVLDDANQRIQASPAYHPRLDEVAKPVTSLVGRGGMVSKLRAARMACDRGAHVAILPGKTPNVLEAFFAGEDIGTILIPDEARRSLKSRAHWIAHTLRPNGQLYVDAGAKEALLHHGRSLLSKGIVRFEGEFSEGDSVEVVGIDEPSVPLARGLVRYGTATLQEILNTSLGATPKQSSALSRQDAVIHRDDLVLLTASG
ncbi:MAG: glutamate 5-kinase [Myxococcales bacterium]|nr:glutamate 5-kinase [Myxococcales bacterium]